MNEHNPSKRLFIALPIPSPSNRSLDKYCRQLGGQRQTAHIRYTPASNRHLTLVFLGQLNPTQKADAIEVVEKLQHPPVHLELAVITRFPDHQSRIITARPKPCSELDSLHQQLYQALEQKGFPCMTRPFRPHITLARMKYENKDLHITFPPPISMVASDVILYESQLTDSSSIYTPLVRSVLNTTTQ